MSCIIVAKTPAGELHLCMDSLPNREEEGSAYIDKQLIPYEADNFFIQENIKEAVSNFNPCWEVSGFRHNDERGTTRILIKLIEVKP